jgi:hypothetical protein
MIARKGLLVLAVFLLAWPRSAPISLAGQLSDLVIENSPEKIKDGGIKAELRGVRIVTSSPIFLESAPIGVTVPQSVVVEAVERSPGLKEALNLSPEPGA